MTINNAVIHDFTTTSPWIAKAQVNLRDGRKIVVGHPMADQDAARAWLHMAFGPDFPVRVIKHSVR